MAIVAAAAMRLAALDITTEDTRNGVSAFRYSRRGVVNKRLAVLAFAAYLALVSPARPTPTVSAFASDVATLVHFTFDGELYASPAPFSRTEAIHDQLLYTIGHLNEDRAVGRLPAVVLSNVRSAVIGGSTRIRYRAVLPVAWGALQVPKKYTLRLPRRVDYAGVEEFADRYKSTCVDYGAHDVDTDSMWYYYRPKRTGCVLRRSDVVTMQAAVQVATENTAGKYPEYNRVWDDNALDVLVVFGKYEAGAATASDAGIAAYNQFRGAIEDAIGPDAVTVPAVVPASPGVASPDIMFTKTVDGKRTTVTMLLVDTPTSAGAAFDARYASLSTSADLIIYNGHSGLGAIVRALARKATFAAGKYLLFFMNSTDSFAYVDRSLAERRALLNPDDPGGTKYMDMVTNAMPAYFASMSSASLALILGLRDHAAPRTYDEMLSTVDSSQVALVTGEEDNTYTPGPDAGVITDWTGMNDAAFVARNEERAYETPLLGAGNYTFTMTHDPANPGGDADLYVRRGQAPTTSTYDCRPYTNGSNEACEIQLTTPTRLFVVVRGYADRDSHFLITGHR